MVMRYMYHFYQVCALYKPNNVLASSSNFGVCCLERGGGGKSDDEIAMQMTKTAGFVVAGSLDAVGSGARVTRNSK